VYSWSFNIQKILLLFAGLFIFSCETEPEFDNPLDPENPEFEIPTVFIDADFAAGDTLASETVTVTLVGNELVSEYRYKFDQAEWTPWATDSIVTFSYIDEGDHAISAQSIYVSGDTSEVYSLEFVVNAVHGPALRVFPLLTNASVSELKTVSIYLEEVENVKGTEFELAYDPLVVAVQSVEKGSLLNEFSGESVLIDEQFNSNGQNIIRFDIAVAIGDEPGLSGSGPVAVIEFMPVSAGDFILEISEEATFRDYNNVEISINEIVNGRMVVTP
jgi:hypothetical protein